MFGKKQPGCRWFRHFGFGPIDATGNFSPTNGFSLLKRFNDPPQLLISPYNNQLNLFERGTSAQRQYISDTFHSMTNSSSIASALNAAPILPNVDWRTTSIASNGDLYVVGQPPLGTPTITDRTIAWSDDNGFTWQNSLMNGPGPAGGSVGNNLVIDELGGQRHLYCGNLFLRDTSVMSTWHNPGKLKINDLNSTNDGKTLADPLMKDIKYHSTNVGFGYSVDTGDSIYGWNEGIEAVQINDIDMNNDFSIGWVASKSGVRKVENYDTPSELWHPTYFPNLDGSPYLSVAVDSGDNDVVFAGNIRVYRTTNGGTITGSDDGWEEVFTPEQSPYSFNRINTKCNTIAISELNDQVIMAGFSQDYSNKGGVFYSLDQGASWMQLLLNVSTTGEDLDVNDIEMVEESGNVVAYIGVEADASTSGAYGVYRAELSSGVWSVTQETAFGPTNHAVDLELNTTRDTLIVLYTDPFSLFTNNVLLKDLSTGTWGTNHPGPLLNNAEASAITVGNKHLFLAIEEKIYTCPFSSIFSWSLAYSYPVGIDINVLFYDELLVGTSTGLYAHTLELTTSEIPKKKVNKNNFAFYDNRSNLIKIVADEVMVQATLFDVDGKLITTSYPNSTSCKFDSTQSGVYMVNIINLIGEVFTFKVIVIDN